MKTRHFIMMAAVVLAGLTGCTSEDNVVGGEPAIQTGQTSAGEATVYHVSIPAALGGEQSQTRALSFTGSGMSAFFTAGEDIYVYNETKQCFACNSRGGILSLEPTGISDDGKTCQLVGDLTFYKFNGSTWEAQTVDATDTYSLFYQMSFQSTQDPANSFFEFDTQSGTTDGVSIYDFGMATGVKMTLDGTTLKLTGTAKFELLQSIFHQTLTFKDGETTVTPIIKEMVVSSTNQSLLWRYCPLATGGGIYNHNTVELSIPTPAAFSDLYLALSFHYDADHPASGDCLVVTATDEDGNVYTCVKPAPEGGFKNGMFYDGAMTLTKQATLTITPKTSEVTVSDGEFVTGTGGANTHLKIKDGATVTLFNLTNTSISNTRETSFPGIECLGNATIILEGENSVKGEWDKAGIYVPEGKTLTIRGGGMLTATANDGAGIGGNKGASCGNIVIEGGTINATGTNHSAGIGSGDDGSCGNITITGGNITATGGDYAAGIGSGYEGSCGNITITGGNITATGGSEAAGIGSGHANKTANTCGNITITGGNITATGGDYAAGIGSGDTNQAAVTCGDISISGSAQVTATGGSEAAGIGSGHANLAANTCGDISISGSAQVTATGGSEAAGIGSGHANLAAVTCGDISISGSAQVTATGGLEAAGIGSGHAEDAANTCGNISISGSAKVTATGGKYAAGIGSGNGHDDGSNIYVSSCDAISIEGGTIEARGGDRAAGIGSGENGKFASISIGSDITSVTATSGGQYYAPIGKGEEYNLSLSGDVTIDGVTIDGGINYSPYKQYTPSATTNLNWTLSGNTWTLTPKN